MKDNVEQSSINSFPYCLQRCLGMFPHRSFFMGNESEKLPPIQALEKCFLIWRNHGWTLWWLQLSESSFKSVLSQRMKSCKFCFIFKEPSLKSPPGFSLQGCRQTDTWNWKQLWPFLPPPKTQDWKIELFVTVCFAVTPINRIRWLGKFIDIPSNVN